MTIQLPSRLVPIGAVVVLALAGLLLLPVVPAAAQTSACASLPSAIELAISTQLTPGGDSLLTSSTTSGPFTVTTTVTATCTIDNSRVTSGTIRTYASNSPDITTATITGAPVGAPIPPSVLFSINDGAFSGLGCGAPAAAFTSCDIALNASGQVTFTTTSPTANLGANPGPVLVGSHREALITAFGTNLFTAAGLFFGPAVSGHLFEQAGAATPELDSFVLFGAGLLGLAGIGFKRRRAASHH